ncbi:hypothetical protein PV341_12105, partial [Streptomyces sp. PA03-1a]|nr:hypothetical protein [Streptomyces sp. PA03-1a]
MGVAVEGVGEVVPFPAVIAGGAGAEDVRAGVVAAPPVVRDGRDETGVGVLFAGVVTVGGGDVLDPGFRSGPAGESGGQSTTRQHGRLDSLEGLGGMGGARGVGGGQAVT